MAQVRFPPIADIRRDRHSSAMRNRVSYNLSLILLLGGSFATAGCVAGLAASAVSMAARGAQGEPQSNEHLKPVAQQTCSAHAVQFGTVHIIDVEQRSPAKIVVWGTVTSMSARRSFECTYTTKIVGFKLRAISA
jgi:hypothetical protein